MDARRLINTPALHKNIYKQLKTNNVDYFFPCFLNPAMCLLLLGLTSQQDVQVI